MTKRRVIIIFGVGLKSVGDLSQPLSTPSIVEPQVSNSNFYGCSLSVRIAELLNFLNKF
jgi:hypothetical protein